MNRQVAFASCSMHCSHLHLWSAHITVEEFTPVPLGICIFLKIHFPVENRNIKGELGMSCNVITLKAKRQDHWKKCTIEFGIRSLHVWLTSGYSFNYTSLLSLGDCSDFERTTFNRTCLELSCLTYGRRRSRQHEVISEKNVFVCIHVHRSTAFYRCMCPIFPTGWVKCVLSSRCIAVMPLCVDVFAADVMPVWLSLMCRRYRQSVSLLL